MYPGHHASFPRRSQSLSATGSQASAMPLGMVHVPSLPQPLSRQPPLRGGGLFIGAAMSNAVKTRQREISAQHPPKPRGTATQTRTGGKAAAAAPSRIYAPTRDEGHAPTQTQGHSHPNAHRRHSRRSSTRQDKRANARLRPRTQPNPKRHSQPKRAPAAKAAAAAPSRIYAPNAKLRAPASASGRITPPNARPGAPTTRTRQRRAAQAAQTAVGDAKVRILLRDDHVQSLRQRKVTSHQAKSAFLWGYPRFFWQDKRNGVQKTKQGAYSGVLLFYFFSCIVFRSSPQACGCSRSRRSCRGK